MQTGKPSSPLVDEHIPVDCIADNAVIRIKEQVRYVYNESELKVLKDEFYSVNQRMAARQELGKALKSCLDNDPEPIEAISNLLDSVMPEHFGYDGIKPLKARHAELLKVIGTGAQVSEETLYGYDYQDAGLMAFYDGLGFFHFDRPLTEQEKQTSIVTQIRATA